jgi:hypothetical protein
MQFSLTLTKFSKPQASIHTALGTGDVAMSDAIREHAAALSDRSDRRCDPPIA